MYYLSTLLPIFPRPSGNNAPKKMGFTQAEFRERRADLFLALGSQRISNTSPFNPETGTLDTEWLAFIGEG